MPKPLRLVCVAGALALGLAAALPARAQSAAEFYAGKTITFIVGYTVGASYDSQSRMLARHWGRHIPGKPNVVIQNMPGAGSMTSANHLYNAATKDGLVVGMFARGMFLEALIEGQGVRFDPLQFNWIGSHGKEVSVILSGAKTEFKTIADIQAKEMLVAATGPGADTYTFPLIINAIIGTKMKLVTGYPGNAEALLSVERGETHGNSGTSIGSLAALKPSWLTEKGHVNFIAQIATEKHPTLLQGVPMVMELAKTDLDRAALRLAFSRQSIAYAFAAPPGVPADRVKALRDGFNAVVKDPQLAEDAKKLYTDIEALTGEQVSEVIKQAYASARPAIERVKQAVQVGTPAPGAKQEGSKAPAK